MRIALIGLGTAGACMLDSLHRALADHSDVSLTLYDSAPEPWRGRAFQDDNPEVLANTFVDGMSIRHGDVAHAERWLVDQGVLEPGSSLEVYFPRALYGQYMAQHADELVQDLRRRGWRVEFVNQSATSLAPNGTSGYVVQTEDRRDEFDYVILCAGGNILASPFDLEGSDGYVANPYPTRERLRDIPSDATVGVLGSGLTAVDVAVVLRERGHSGPIRMYSRSGTLPLARRPGPKWTAKHFTLDRLVPSASPSNSLLMADVERLFNQEVSAWGGEPRGLFAPAPLSTTAEWLRRQLEQPHDASDLATFIFQKSVVDLWQDIWCALHPDEQRRVLASPSTIRAIMSSSSPMTRPNAEKVLAMLDSGQLEVRGGVTSVARGEESFEIRLTEIKEQADYIVNAVTPPDYGVHPQVKELVDSAVAHGLARRHHAGGLEVMTSSSAVAGSRGPGRLYALGDLTRGAFFFIFGVPFLVRRSADIARAIHDDMLERTLAHRAPVSVTV